MGALPPSPPSPPPMVADDGDEELAPLQLPSPASFEQVTVRVRTEATSHFIKFSKSLRKRGRQGAEERIERLTRENEELKRINRAHAQNGPGNKLELDAVHAA